MSSPLPDVLDPRRAADSRSVFTGRLPLSSLPRLCASLLDMAGDVRFRLAFFRDEAHRAVLKCEVTATLKLPCQRCLEALDHQVDAGALLAVVSGIDEERRLPEHYDPLPADKGMIRPRDLIEDELLLAIPQIPMHAPDACRIEPRESDQASARSGRDNPFAVLERLKQSE